MGPGLELTSLGRVVLRSGEQGWVTGAEDVCGVTKGCTSGIRMILGNVCNNLSPYKLVPCPPWWFCLAMNVPWMCSIDVMRV